VCGCVGVQVQVHLHLSCVRAHVFVCVCVYLCAEAWSICTIAATGFRQGIATTTAFNFVTSFYESKHVQRAQTHSRTGWHNRPETQQEIWRTPGHGSTRHTNVGTVLIRLCTHGMSVGLCSRVGKEQTTSALSAFTAVQRNFLACAEEVLKRKVV